MILSLAAEHDLPLLTPSTAWEGVVPETRDEFLFHPISCRKVREVVQSFPSNKAPGYDKVSMAVIKDALPCILPTLTEIVNRSLMSSVFPSRWKESEVIPLLKEGILKSPQITAQFHYCLQPQKCVSA